MKNAVLSLEPKLVRLEGENYTILEAKYTLDGYLSRFRVGPGEGIAYSYSDSILIDGKYRKSGYCKENIEKAYKNHEISLETFLLDENWFDHLFENAQVGDLFYSSQCNFYIIEGGSNSVKDYVTFYRKNAYYFKITSFEIAFHKSETYPPFNEYLESDNYSIAFQHNYNEQDTIQGRFYKKNFADKLATIGNNLEDGDIERIAKYMLRISFQLHWIFEEDLLSLIAINDRLWV